MNEVDGVVLDVIQITDDQRRTDDTSAFNTRTEQPRLLLLDPAREGGKVEGDGTSSSTTAWWWWRSAGLQQGFAKHYERRGGRGVGLRQQGD